MSEIPYDEEVTRDWDWFAVDSDGNLGHFATGAFRRLPSTARMDWESLEELISYFESAPATGSYATRPEFEKWQSFKSGDERSRYT